MNCSVYELKYYLPYTATTAMSHSTSPLENMKPIAAISSVPASLSFLAANLLF
jgi:hypothetical protein